MIKTPWFIKFAAKIILSRLPLNYHTWIKAGMFRHGRMNEPGYALSVFLKHRERVKLPEAFTALEIGPGDSLFSALIAAAHGATRIHLVDVGNFATTNMQDYRKMRDHLMHQNLLLPQLSDAASIDEWLKRLNTTYHTNGLTSIRNIPAESIDFIWSHATLEHIKKSEVPDFLTEIRRILKPGGFCSHRIDLKDHLAQSLNNLRFSPSFWESDFISRSGFYTNRLRHSEWLKEFNKAGLYFKIIKTDCWNSLPVKKSKLDPAFSRFDESELLVSGFDVILSRSQL